MVHDLFPGGFFFLSGHAEPTQRNIGKGRKGGQGWKPGMRAFLVTGQEAENQGHHEDENDAEENEDQGHFSHPDHPTGKPGLPSMEKGLPCPLW